MSNNGPYKKSAGMNWYQYQNMRQAQKEGRDLYDFRAPEREVFAMRIQPTNTGPMGRIVRPQAEERYEGFDAVPEPPPRGCRPRIPVRETRRPTATMGRLGDTDLSEGPVCGLPSAPEARPVWNYQGARARFRPSDSIPATSSRKNTGRSSMFAPPTTGKPRWGAVLDKEGRDKYGNVDEGYVQRRKEREEAKRLEYYRHNPSRRTPLYSGDRECDRPGYKPPACSSLGSQNESDNASSSYDSDDVMGNRDNRRDIQENIQGCMPDDIFELEQYQPSGSNDQENFDDFF